MTGDERESDAASRTLSRREAREQREAEQRRRRRHRMVQVGFGAILVVLVGAIPVLGLVGRHLIENSTDGKVLTPVSDPNAPGYEALVDPTPTALVVQTDPQGKVNSATVLALGNGEAGGGSVVLVPIDTKLRVPGNGVDRLRYAYQFGGVQTFRNQVADLVGVGFGEVIEVGDARWAELVRPIGSVTIDNPDDVTGAGGQDFPAGKLTLTPDQVGPFLGASVDGTSDLNRLVRQQLFWQAWIKAVAAGGNKADLVPGEAGNGISRFVRTLAKGVTDVSVLAVNDIDDGKGGPAFSIDEGQVHEQMALAVPFPIGAFPGQRTRVRVLNGVKPGPLPNHVTDTLVLGGAEIDVLGNANTSGQTQTRIEYYTRGMKDRATLLRGALGFGKLVYKPSPDQSVDVTVTIGSDVQQATIDQPSTTVPTTISTTVGDQTTSGGDGGDLSTTTTSPTLDETTTEPTTSSSSEDTGA